MTKNEKNRILYHLGCNRNDITLFLNTRTLSSVRALFQYVQICSSVVLIIVKMHVLCSGFLFSELIVFMCA